jgi:hypothetical protein
MPAEYVVVDSRRLSTETLNLPESTMALKIDEPMLPLAYNMITSCPLKWLVRNEELTPIIITVLIVCVMLQTESFKASLGEVRKA